MPTSDGIVKAIMPHHMAGGWTCDLGLWSFPRVSQLLLRLRSLTEPRTLTSCGLESVKVAKICKKLTVCVTRIGRRIRPTEGMELSNDKARNIIKSDKELYDDLYDC